MIKRNNTNNTQLSPIISNTDNIAKNIIDAHFDNWWYKTEYISELIVVTFLKFQNLLFMEDISICKKTIQKVWFQA